MRQELLETPLTSSGGTKAVRPGGFGALPAATNHPITWKHSRLFHPEYELRAGDEPLAAMRFKRGSPWRAEVETAAGRWSFERRGLVRSHITLRELSSGQAMATLTVPWTNLGIVLELSSGKSYGWRRSGGLRMDYRWETPDGQVLVRFLSNTGRMGGAGSMQVERGAGRAPDLELLILAGWYLMVSRSRRD